MLWDINVNLFNFINHTLQNSFFDSFMPIMTHFGGFKFLFAFLLVIIIYSYIKNYQTINRIAVLALISLLLTDLVVVLLKFSVCETRPFFLLVKMIHFHFHQATLLQHFQLLLLQF